MKPVPAGWAFVCISTCLSSGPLGLCVVTGSSIFQVGLFPVSWLPRFSVRTGE